jgi:hypothetical protein
MRIVSLGGEWNITLVDGSVVRVWADGYQTEDGHHDFGLLVDTEGAELDTVSVTNRTPRDPDRVVISVARLPVTAVADISGG